MRFKLYEEYQHWPFEGINYKLQFYLGDVVLNKITAGLELKMMDWLEEHKISHAWNIEDVIVFKHERDRTLFVLRFS